LFFSDPLLGFRSGGHQKPQGGQHILNTILDVCSNSHEISSVNLSKIQDPDRIWTEFNGKEMWHFCCEKVKIFKAFGLGP